MQPVDTPFPNGAAARVTPVRTDIVRVQVAPGGAFTDSALNRYGFIHEPEDPPALAPETGGEGYALPGLRVAVDGPAGTLCVADPDGAPLLQLLEARFGQGTATAVFEAAEDEDWTGFGDVTRDRLFHRGHTADCWVENVRAYVPVPFFMSTRGYGVLVNTTHQVLFDMAASESGRFRWRDRRGVLDFYVLVGGAFAGLIERYTWLTGRPALPPVWSFGLWYICRTQANDYEAVNDAVNFRREGIPCDVIGLEPGWMERNYDYTTDKQWSSERFPVPAWCPTGPNNFVDALKRLGYHLELWLCCNYDLSLEEERRIGNRPGGPDSRDDGSADDGFEQDERLGRAYYQDAVTKRDEPWFEHLKTFVDQGADFFKQDGSQQVDAHPDRLYGNGMTDEEMHNLYPLLYGRQMYEGFLAHTGRRPVVFTCAGWAGFQAFAGTWTGDVGGGPGTVTSMLNTSFVGHSFSTNDMEVHTLEGMHFGYLQPWSQINSWTYFRMPWVLGADLLQRHREYAQLRSRLIPYLYTCAWEATQTGMPVMRPLALAYPEDPACRDVRNAYLLGADLLVTAFTEEAYLPPGRWKDFWTGAVLEGGRTHPVTPPANRGGGLFLREGGLLPLGPVMQYRGERPVDEVHLHVFPSADEQAMAFYEDDGVTMAHAEGRFAVTPVSTVRDGKTIRVRVGEPEGGFPGQPGERTWTVTVAVDSAPATVEAAGKAAVRRNFDERRGEVHLQAMPGPLDLTLTLH